MIKSRGLSIVEFLISITLGVMVVTGVITIYVSNKTTFNIQEGIARIQENGRFINYYLTKEVRMAGFQGCTNQKNITLVNQVKNPSAKITSNKSIFGFESISDTAWSPTLPSYLTGKVEPGTDVLAVSMVDTLAIQLKNPMAQPTSAITVYDRTQIQQNDIIIISDCTVGDIFVAGATSSAAAIAHGSNENISSALSKAYDTEASIMKYTFSAFYIKDTGRTNSNGQAIRALYYQDLSGNEIEIAEGIDDIQITYGVDNDGDNNADVYQTASAVEAANNWDNVISVNTNILVSSVEQVSPQIQPYRFNGATVTPTDRQLRREWNNFITLRNRALE
jgi:type IV pilus assembly protein PilW